MTQDHIYTITEAAKMTGYEAHVIRFYEKEFNLQIPRNKSGHRYFTTIEVNQLRNIKKLQEKGYSNTQIKMFLSNPNLLKTSEEVIDSTDIAKTAAITSNDSQEFNDYFLKTKNEIFDGIKTQFEILLKSHHGAIAELSKDIKTLIKSIEIPSQDKIQNNDVALCETAKLKMQLKQKDNEILDLQEKLNHKEGKNKSWWKK